MSLRTLTAAVALLAASAMAHATYTISIVQSGTNVVMSGTGSLNTTGLTFTNAGPTCAGNNGFINSSLVCIGSGRGDVVAPAAFTPALNGLSTGGLAADTSTGTSAFIAGNTLYFGAPYVSGTPIANSSTFLNKTFTDLGVTAGTTRTLALPSGDTIFIRVGPPPVAAVTSIPTLSEYGLMALASLMAMVGFAAMKRKREG